MLYADGASVISESLGQLRKMITAIETVCVAFDVAISEAQTAIMYFFTKGMPYSAATLSSKIVDKTCNKMQEFIYLRPTENSPRPQM